MRTNDRELALGLYRTRLTESILDVASRCGIERLDCAFNYGNFSYLDSLGKLKALDRFSISSKVGFFPASNQSNYHSLDSKLLRSAAEQTVASLGGPVSTLFLHNPERSLSGDRNEISDALAEAAATMNQIVSEGLAAEWGVSCWHPEVLIPVATSFGSPGPQALMTRVGLATPWSAIQAAQRLVSELGLDSSDCWGMSPLGGSRADELIAAADVTSFVVQPCTNAEAVLRASFELPPVRIVCFSSSSETHIRQATRAADLDIDEEVLSRYRVLVASR